VPRLALLLRDLYPPRVPEPGEAGERLPSLEHWLARGDARAAEGGWRAWLAAATLGAALPPGQGGAGLAAAALLDGAAGRYYWFATPVHYVAGLDTLHLPAAGLLTLSAAEQQALVTDFRRVFTDAPWRLHALGYRDLLLEGPDPGEHATEDPAGVAGSDLAAAQPRGAGVRPLRQLAAEIEMWLFEHPLNRERERRDELPVTGLWPWGGGAAAAAVRAPAARIRVHGADAYSAALAAAAGQSLQATPAHAEALLATNAGVANADVANADVADADVADADVADADVAVVLSGACTLGWPDLLRLEQQWFAPLLAQLAAGRWSALTLVLGARRHELRSWHRWRAWRRPRPWWAQIGR
jgi:hypothetical protein